MKGIKGFQKGHGRFRTDESYKISGAKISLAKLGKKHNAETIRKLSEAHKGKHHSPATEFKKGQVSPRKGKNFPQVAGDKHYAWKGGITPINEKIRHSLEYRIWRRAVMERDNFTCVECSKRGGELHADHIKPFALYPELRFAIDNGQTLCAPCHRKTPTYGWTNIYKVKQLAN